ncbi:fungal-specific transcription factor domain-containing protein [Trichoderma sp. SZMC 28014]
MFYTFQGVKGKAVDRSPQSSSDGNRSQDAGGKAGKSLHACLECQRRKIRCDGKQPCNRCQSSRSRRRCVYEQHRQRLVPSRKSLEEISRSLEECRSVLRRLYPNHEVSQLLSLTRQELRDLLDQPMLQEIVDVSVTPPSVDEAQHPQELENMPAPKCEWDEERREKDQMPVEADDVNALSLSMGKQAASYLGASSVKVALTVMLQIQPQLQVLLAAQSSPDGSSDENARTNKIPLFRAAARSSKANPPIPWTYKGQALIDAYFKRVHCLSPMLDENSFRKHYNEGRRCDAPWLSLLNMVFATSSIMSTPSSNLSHIKYYNQAIEHFHLSAFGSSHIETIQALALLGGYYLHYINRPNMANAIIGAILRMATALGLHREPPPEEQADTAVVETRRRTWWTLFCLDTWGTTTLGRPSFGRWGPAINIQPPKLITEQEEADSAQYAGIMPLLENIKFCKIATKVQDMLALNPLLRTEDRSHLDSLLVDWYNNLPWLLRSTEPCVEPLHLSRSIMIWRYWNLRMLLYRPVLLTLACKTQSPIDEQDVVAVQTCQNAARETIDSISMGWTRQQMSGWNAVWFLYQAAMIPLVSILWQPDNPSVVQWRAQVESILDLFEAMQDWSLTARRSRDVVSRLLEASSQISNARQGIGLDDPSLQKGGPSGEVSGFWGGEGIDALPSGYGTGDIVDMLDQDWPWDMDVDGLAWGQQIPLLEEDGSYSVDGSMGVDYLSLAAAENVLSQHPQPPP